MYHDDQAQLADLLTQIVTDADRWLNNLAGRPPAVTPTGLAPLGLPARGSGAMEALTTFRTRYAAHLSGSAGPRYFGFVTGGVTPAALMGDWLTAVYDQNAIGYPDGLAARLELDTLALIRELLALPAAFDGSFVTGATMSNLVGLATGRQWVGRQLGVDVAQAGLTALPPIAVLSGTPHSSIFKALAMLGMGRSSVQPVACLPGREAVDVAALDQALHAVGAPCIVVANAGTVNTVDFDDLTAIADLRARYPFWLHVDAAFGGFAACAPETAQLVAGMSLADSICVDAHKYLNVPYDAALQFTRHLDLQTATFANSAVYLDREPGPDAFIHLTPENSRRLRSLPAWFTLVAYGRDGHRAIVERTTQLAQELRSGIAGLPGLRLVGDCRLNGFVFTLDLPPAALTMARVRDFLALLQADGRVFMTPTLLFGLPAIRGAVTNWRTQQADISIVLEALAATVAEFQRLR